MAPLYPDLNAIRRCSENFEKSPYNAKISEKILSKGPAITKDILEKMQHSEIAPNNTNICGRNIPTRRIWVLGALVVLFLLSFSGTIIMWFTREFEKGVLAKIKLVEGTEGYEMWQKPPPKPLIKIYIFNYTNVEEFEKGQEKKLRVEELGPYVYEAHMERVNVHHNGNGTITYQDRRTFKFLPELSNGRRQSDRLIVPNLPMLGAAARGRHSYYLSRLALSSLLKGLNSKPFLSLPAHRFIWGYDDSLYTLAKGILALKNEMLYERFGIMSNKMGTSNDVVTIFTGENGFDNYGMIDKYNGESRIGQWSTEECDVISASDGTIYPPNLIKNKKDVAMYHKEMCRLLPLRFQKEVKIFNGEIKAYKYVVPDDVFDTPEKNLKNQCYCDMESGECPPQGVFNSTPCSFGAPAFISFPHFYNGDPKLKEAIDGLDPNPQKHSTYAYLHPKLGFPMAGQMRLQMNIQVMKSFGISQLDMFEDDLMLPVAWVETGLDDTQVPQETVDLINKATFTTRGLELTFQYGCLLTAILTLVFLIVEMKTRWQTRGRTNSNSSSAQLQNDVTEI